MKLITTELEARFKEIGDQSETKDPFVIAKFFNPVGSGTWYATKYDPEINICYGYVTGLGYDGCGEFSINELAAVKLPFGLSIERDLYFKEQNISAFITQRRIHELEGTFQEEDKEQGIERE